MQKTHLITSKECPSPTTSSNRFKRTLSGHASAATFARALNSSEASANPLRKLKSSVGGEKASSPQGDETVSFRIISHSSVGSLE